MECTVNMDHSFRLVSEKEAAKILGMTVSWLQRGRCYHYGPLFVKMNHPKGAIRYRTDELDAFIRANTVDPKAHTPSVRLSATTRSGSQ
jgi:hypothetical protein